MILDKHAEQDFPVGSLVIVTHSESLDACRRGEVLEVLSEPFIWWCGGITPNGFGMRGAPERNGYKCVCLKWPAASVVYAHPVVYLRPLADPDAKTIQTERRKEHAV